MCILVDAQIRVKVAVEGSKPGRVLRFRKFSGKIDPVFFRDVVVLSVTERDLIPDATFRNHPQRFEMRVERVDDVQRRLEPVLDDEADADVVGKSDGLASGHELAVGDHRMHATDERTTETESGASGGESEPDLVDVDIGDVLQNVKVSYLKFNVRTYIKKQNNYMITIAII